MAGASGKRIASQNAATVKQLRTGFAISGVVYLFALLAFRSGRTWTRLLSYIATEVIAVFLWVQLEGMASRGDDLAGPGLTSYMFDVVYVTWFVHVTTALVSTKFWYFYLSIPGYALYRVGKLALPRLWPSSSSGTANGNIKGASKVGVGQGVAGETTPTLSKRQEKLKKRSESGQVRVERR